MRAGAIIVAAGSSTRMGGADKLLRPLAGRPVIAHSVAVFAMHSRIDEVVVVTSEANAGEIDAALRAIAPDARLVRGGPRRRDSVLNGLEALQACDYVLVHDGARPLVRPGLIDAALDCAIETGAALCAVSVSDTVKRTDEAGLVHGTISREHLWLAQTPQAFRFDVLRRAHASSDIEATDDAALVELMGEPVRIVEGAADNIKITTTPDLALATAILAAREA